MSSSPEKLPTPSLVQQFRTRTGRQKIHPQEMALLVGVSAVLVYQSWAYGSMRPVAQSIALGLSVVAFILALVPRAYEDAGPGQAPFRLYTWPKLIRFPIFWIGLVMLGIIVIQGLNPAWAFTTNGKTWWIEAIPHIEWLPAGMRVPFERWGPWRMLMIYATVWFTVCSIWIGFTRRKTFQAFFTLLAGNAFLLAALGIAQRATNAKGIFWYWTPTDYFVSSFTYKNHAGAYFNLMLALCAGLAFWYYERSLRRLDKSGPSGLFAFFGTAVAMIVIFSYSRTATVLMFGFLAVTFGIFLWRVVIRARPGERNPLMLIMVTGAFAAFLWIGATSLNTSRFTQGINKLSSEVETLNGRVSAIAPSWDMINARPVSGWGAGCFRFAFPRFQINYPDAWKQFGGRVYWEHPHNDYLEFLSEWGWLGAGLVLTGAGFALWHLLRLRVWSNPLALFLVLGCAVTMAHASIEYLFYNPAILNTWIALLFGTIRWVELEEIATGA